MARDLKGMSKRDLEREVVKLRHLLSRTLGAGETLEYESGVSMDSGEPFVRLMWGEEVGQMPPGEVRRMATNLVETAAAAEFDAALMDVLVERFDFDKGQAVSVLILMREERLKRRPDLRTPGVEDIQDQGTREQVRREIDET
jgi:hypothetical protein